MKRLIFTFGVSAILFASCGGGKEKDTSTGETADNKEMAADDKTIKDEKLYPFILGGVYFFHGYGGGKQTLDQLVKGQIQSKRGDDDFKDDLHTVYTNYFVYPFKPEDGAGARQTLEEFWEITDKPSFLKRQEELLSNGHQAEYMALSAAGATPETEEEKEQVAFIQANKAAFGPQGIKAWDIARYVNNVAMGYAAGYLTQSEGDAALAKLAPMVKGKFSSWDEYWKSFNLGRKFWAGDAAHDAEFDNTSKEMLQGDYSIYNYMKL